MRRLDLRIRLALAALAIACVLAAWFVNATETQALEAARTMAGLAPLPPSALGVRVYRNSHLTWTGYYVRFTAPAPDIETFLAASPGLRGKTAETFTPKHQFLPVPAGRRLRDLLDSPHAYFEEYGSVVRSSAPWFDRTIRTAGRRYRVTYNDNSGEIVVNDASHVVYVYVYDS